MRKHGLFSFGHALCDVPLNRPRGLRLGQSKTPAQARDVGIHRDPRQAEGIAAHHQRGLAPDAGQGGELVDAAGHLPIEVRDELFPDA